MTEKPRDGSEIPAEVSAPVDDEKRLMELMLQGVGDQARDVIQRNAERKRDLETVRNASYGSLTVEDLLRPGGYADLYMNTWYGPDVIKLHVEGRNEDFEKRTDQGGVVFDFTEKQLDPVGKGYDSVYDQLLVDLQGEEAKGQGAYMGRTLTDPATGEILAAATWTMPPGSSEESHSPYAMQILEYMEKGITGGEMQFASSFNWKPEDFVKASPQLVYFDTLIGGRRYAASRLFAEITQEMKALNPHLKHFLLYHLSCIKVYQDQNNTMIPIRDDPFSLGGNEKSKNFFGTRMCRKIGEEFNERGPRSPRIIDGNPYWVVPGWKWRMGDFSDVHDKSQQIYQQIIDSVTSVGS